MKFNLLGLSIALLIQVSTLAQIPQPIRLKADSSIHLEVREPSDLFFDAKTNTLLFVSDEGYIVETSTAGKHIKTSKQVGYDSEGITMKGDSIIIVDEFTRVFGIYDRDFNRLRNVRVNYSGGRNMAFESLAWIPEHHRFVTLTEKSPIWVLILNEDLSVYDEFELPFKTRDISAATWHQGHLWLLSDEDRTAYKCTFPELRVTAAYKLPVINPEGITFDDQGNMLISSDDRERLYFFHLPDLMP